MTAPRTAGNRTHLAWLLLLACPWGREAAAQTIALDPDANDPTQVDLGRIVAAANGTTIFQIDPSSGAVSPPTGQGVRLDTGTVLIPVTVTCAGDDCDTASAAVTIAPTGQTGRALALTNFTVAASGGDAAVITNENGNDPLTFTISGIPEEEQRRFHVGVDFGIADSGDTGPASASFTVQVGESSRAVTLNFTAVRAISLAKQADLLFGRVVQSVSEDGSVHMDASSGDLSVTGNGVVALDGPTAAPARFEVTGEAGQSFSIHVPETFSMTSGANSLTVTPNIDVDDEATPVLAGTAGQEGSYAFQVGGSFDLPAATPSGAYSGHFAVTVEYN